MGWMERGRREGRRGEERDGREDSRTYSTVRGG